LDRHFVQTGRACQNAKYIGPFPLGLDKKAVPLPAAPESIETGWRGNKKAFAPWVLYECRFQVERRF
jgi:hypothetical protein